MFDFEKPSPKKKYTKEQMFWIYLYYKDRELYDKLKEESYEEILERRKKYREEHKEELAEYQKKYRKEHREKVLKLQKKYYEEHRDEILEKAKEYKRKHKDEILEKAKEYYKENREEKIKKQKKYNKEHKDKVIVYKKRHQEKHKEHILYIQRIRNKLKSFKNNVLNKYYKNRDCNELLLVLLTKLNEDKIVISRNSRYLELINFQLHLQEVVESDLYSAVWLEDQLVNLMRLYEIYLSAGIAAELFEILDAIYNQPEHCLLHTESDTRIF